MAVRARLLLSVEREATCGVPAREGHAVALYGACGCVRARSLFGAALTPAKVLADLQSAGPAQFKADLSRWVCAIQGRPVQVGLCNSRQTCPGGSVQFKAANCSGGALEFGAHAGWGALEFRGKMSRIAVAFGVQPDSGRFCPVPPLCCSPSSRVRGVAGPALIAGPESVCYSNGRGGIGFWFSR